MKFFASIRTFLSSRFGRSSEREHGLSSSETESRLSNSVHREDSSPLYNRPDKASVSVHSYFQEQNRNSASSSKKSSISVSSRKDNSSITSSLSQKRVELHYNIFSHVYVSETSVRHSSHKSTTQSPPAKPLLAERTSSPSEASSRKPTALDSISRFHPNHTVTGSTGLSTESRSKETREHNPNNPFFTTSKTPNTTNELQEKPLQTSLSRHLSNSLPQPTIDSLSVDRPSSATLHVHFNHVICLLPQSTVLLKMFPRPTSLLKLACP